MSFLLSFSNSLMPIVMVAIIGYGLIKRVNVFEAFITGATEGLKVILMILPTLVGLLLAVGMLRASGGLDGITRLLTPLIAFTHFPSEAVPIALLRTFSSSASIGLIIDIFKIYGPDSFLGRLVSIMAGCTETIFYTLSVYFMSIHIKNTRYTVIGALLASLVGIIASYVLTLYLFGV